MKRLLLLLLLIPTISLAQNSDLGNWMIYNGSKKIASRFNWHNEVQYRNYNAIGDLEQLLLRTGLGYNLTNKNNNILVGYAFVRSENYTGNGSEKTAFNEHRTFLQFSNHQLAGPVVLNHRYRFEQRFFSNDFKLRFRYFFSVQVPLNKDKMTDKTFYLSAYDELFIQIEKNAFDRNRLYGGLGYKLNSLARFELGYMTQQFSTISRDQMNLMLFLNF